MANKKMSETELDDINPIEFPSSNIALLFGEINNTKASQIVSWILANSLETSKPEELALIINSPGGDAAAAFAIIETMHSSPIPIRTVGLGEIASAGLLIFINGTKGRRVLTPTCTVMSHHFSTVMGGTYHDLVNQKKDLDITHQKILQTYVQTTGKGEAYVMKHFLNPHDAWMTPSEALAHKLADKVSTKSYFQE